jgi:hypothetical protein
MAFVEWKLGLHAEWTRSLTLERAAWAGAEFDVVVREPGGGRWRLHFLGAAAARVTGYDVAAAILNRLPGSGGLFHVVDSPWHHELMAASSTTIEARHYVVCCREAIVEVLARECQSQPKES